MEIDISSKQINILGNIINTDLKNHVDKLLYHLNYDYNLINKDSIELKILTGCIINDGYGIIKEEKELKNNSLKLKLVFIYSNRTNNTHKLLHEATYHNSFIFNSDEVKENVDNFYMDVLRLLSKNSLENIMK